MKKWIIGIVLTLLLVGCSDVQMSPQYSSQVRRAAIVIAELNSRCQDGDEEACRAGLSGASETLDLIVAGMDGRGGEDVE